jgi:hypothetical protein
LIEERIIECCEERSEISSVLSEDLEENRRELYELRIDELGLEIATLWIELRKITKNCDVAIGSDLF